MKGYILILIVGIPFFGLSQQINLPIGDPDYRIIDRFVNLYPSATGTTFVSAFQNYSRPDLVTFLKNVDSSFQISKTEIKQIEHILIQNDEWRISKNQEISNKRIYRDSSAFYAYTDGAVENHKQLDSIQVYKQRPPFLGFLYPSNAHMVSIDKPGISLRLNPIIRFEYGNEKDIGPLYYNQRGVQLRGTIDNKIYFRSRILETQSKAPQYFENYTNQLRALPGNGLYKGYNSNIFNIENGYDFLNATADIGFNVSKHVGVQLGYGNHFLGNGIRSLLLSDFANNFFYVKLDTRVWKFHYQNLFGELSSESPNFRRGDDLVPKKYFATHSLGLKIRPNLEISLFETVIFNRQQFEFQYLNPIILYRSVEHSLGSPDNVIIGANFQWTPFKGLSFYSQVSFDEFKLSEILDGNGWWGNKYGIQLGAKYFNLFGIDQLDAQVELNLIRPYTYTHNDSLANYSHALHPLAHPLGANTKEIIIQLYYNFTHKFFTRILYWSALKGNDSNGINYGGNILLPNTTRVNDFENTIGQGISTSLSRVQWTISYELLHNLCLDLDVNWRTQNNINTFFFNTGIRLNIGKRNELF